MPSIRPAPFALLAAAALAFLVTGSTTAAADDDDPDDAPPPAAAAASAPPAATTTTTTTTTTTVLQPAAPASFVAPPEPPPIVRGNARDDVIRDARDAFARHDRNRLAADRASALAARHPLAEWVDYWELLNRIVEVGPSEIEGFYARWPNTYLEDRLRNDWLLETGRRRDWTAFSRDWPRFRMKDDREVTCYATLVDHLAGKEVRDSARAAWLAQKDGDDGCQVMAQTLYDDKVFDDDDVWRRLRQAAEFGRQRAARGAAQILGKPVLKDLNEVWDNPARFLARHGGAGAARRDGMVVIALARMAASDPGATALQMSERWQGTMGSEAAAWTWAVIAKHGAQALSSDAVDWQDRAWRAWKPGKGDAPDKPDWSDDALAWHARAALRAGGATPTARWRDLLRTVDAMSASERAEPTWVYWRAKAQLALAKDRRDGADDPGRTEALAALNGLAGTLGFYGLLAADDLRVAMPLPPRPAPVTPAERSAAHANGGLQRGLAMTALDFRDEGRREWNYTLRGMGDRELIAAAQWACELADWQLCINTSERTKVEIDLAQRYPMPFQRDIAAAAQASDLEPAFVFGIIRQETRFMPAIRSHVGAAGLMQLMPATAKWVAKKGGIDYRPEMIAEPATNLRLGTSYLKMVLDSFGGSQPMAAAAYNAGPGRPRRWRGTVMVDPAVWTENVPFFETRDYVKKVTANTAIYAALMTGRPPQLRPRLGPQIGPRDAEQPSADLP
jgi:soluble lytic murein transglycosylase